MAYMFTYGMQNKMLGEQKVSLSPVVILAVRRVRSLGVLSGEHLLSSCGSEGPSAPQMESGADTFRKIRC